MKKFVAGMLIAIMLSCVVVPATNAIAVRNTLGSFVEIRHEEYMNENDIWITEYLVYDRDTKLVYLYITDNDMMLSVTPYYMRNYYGEITIGLYNRETGGIDPAEPSRLLDESEVWDIADY